jgi:predicted XRE-type DNA-binding protein
MPNTHDEGDAFVVTESGENVFAVLGLPNADDRLVKADLAIAIKRIIDENEWNQSEAAERARVTQPQISNIRRAKVDSFSIVALQNILRNLGVDVEIQLHRREGGGIGTLRVMQSA